MNSTSASIWTGALTGTFGLVAVAIYYNIARPKKTTKITTATKRNDYDDHNRLPTTPSTTMRRLVVAQPSQDLTQVRLELQEIPIPVPKRGQVLVKMAAMPLHPSVFNAWKSKSAQGQPFGNEGSGVVVASGGGFFAGLLVGRKVGIITSGHGTNEFTSAEYICVDALRAAWSFPDSVDLLDATAWFINPVTALSILDLTATENRCKAVLHTGASSQLGQMLVRLASQKGITVVNLVRRQEHVTMLKELGANHVVCQADKDWLDQLSNKIEELKVKVAFDAVSGDLTGQILSKLPKQGTCYVYGVLSGNPVGGIDPLDLIYRGKKVKGHHLHKSWVDKAPVGPLGKLIRMRSCVQQIAPSLGPGGWASSQFHDCSMQDAEKVFTSMYEKGFTGCKLRVRFDL